MVKFGVDIGGTTVKVGILDEENNIIEKSSVKTLKDEVMTLYLIKEQIDVFIDKYDIQTGEILGIGIGSPGAVDEENGVIEYFPNAMWNHVNVANFFSSAYGVKVRVANDANVATLAEMELGSGKNLNSFVYVTLGTGVGGGVVINRKLFRGNLNKGCEIGHMVIAVGGNKCNCGREGCFEAYASAPALISYAKEQLEKRPDSAMAAFSGNLNGKIVFDCAKSGDVAAKSAVDVYVKYLGEGLLNLMNIFRPDGIILGGGISEAGNVLIDKLNDYCSCRNYGYSHTPAVPITSATYFNDAGILGAALLIK